MTSAATSADGLWSGVVGQPEAVAALRRAAVDPVHAYLLVGPRGAGSLALATAFAADVLAAGSSDPDRARRLVATGEHPDLTVVERTGPAISADTAREIRRLAARPPVEATRKVIVATDFHLVREAGPILLKAVEEPSPSTVFVLLADDVPSEMVTIASRCVRVPVRPVPEVALVDALVSRGVDPDRASTVAIMAGGDLERALLLVDDPDAAARYEAWRSVPDRLDGTGATALALVDELLGSIDGILGPLRERQGAEIERLRAQREQAGLPTSLPKDVSERHRREERRARTDEIRSGLAALAGRLREQVGTGGADRAGLARIAAAGEALARNPNEKLLLQDLLLGIGRGSADRR